MTRRRPSLPAPLAVAAVVDGVVKRARAGVERASALPPLALEVVSLLRDCLAELRALRADVREIPRSAPPTAESLRVLPVETIVELERLRAIKRKYRELRAKTRRARQR